MLTKSVLRMQISKMCVLIRCSCFYVFVFLYAVSYVNCQSLPFISKCHTSDEKCAKSAAKIAVPFFAGGLPEFGVEQLDPKYLKTVDASNKDLKLIFTDCTMKGLKRCIPNKVERNPNDTKMTITMTCDIDFTGHYEMDGKLLFLPIQGKGRAHIKLRKLQLTNMLDIETITGEDGLKHWNIKGWTYSFKLKDQASVALENLFNANEALAKLTKDFVANNGNAIVEEAGPPIIKSIVAKSVNNINNFFHNVPAAEFTTY